MGSDQQARSGSEPRLWDAGHQLSSSARDLLERELTAAERKSGVPVFLLVTDRVPGEAVAEWAARVFGERGLGDDAARNPVLLAVALDSGAAAVETGKGSAGIVPEIDARRIVKELVAHLSARHPERAIGAAVTQLAASARETAARRTPLPRPKPEEPSKEPSAESVAEAADAQVGPSADAVAGPNAAGASPETDETADGGAPGPQSDPASARRGRSRLPVAIGLGVLVLVGLALRRRRQVAASRPADPRDSPADRRRPRP